VAERAIGDENRQRARAEGRVSHLRLHVVVVKFIGASLAKI
jgi:hypothetical protein